ncbi:uncharacterized protein DS421_20g688180 [Arachis hypogaea]|nr:uncharacterized protein DS421_20g688180 [Arachis hypogaea]
MIFSSWNMRGLRGCWKVENGKKFKRKNNVNMLEFIEIKKEVITKFDVVQFWGNDTVNLKFVGSEGASGGLLIMGDDMMFRLSNYHKEERWLCIEEKLTNIIFYLCDLLGVWCVYKGREACCVGRVEFFYREYVKFLFATWVSSIRLCSWKKGKTLVC